MFYERNIVLLVGRAYATSVVFNVCIVAKWCVLPKNCQKKRIGNGL